MGIVVEKQDLVSTTKERSSEFLRDEMEIRGFVVESWEKVGEIRLFVVEDKKFRDEMKIFRSKCAVMNFS